MLTLLLITYVLVWIYFMYMLFRNVYVSRFRRELLSLTADYQTRHIDDEHWYLNGGAWHWFFEKYNYEQMLFSFKRLRLEDWYTPEEIEQIHK